jgi:hypothetical protein
MAYPVTTVPSFDGNTQGKEQGEPRAGGPPVPDRSSGGQRPRVATTWRTL